MLRAALMSRWTFTMGHAAFSHASTSALDRARGVDHQPNRYPRGRKRRNTYGRPRLVGANRWVALHTEHTCRATRQWGSLAPAPVTPREAPLTLDVLPSPTTWTSRPPLRRICVQKPRPPGVGARPLEEVQNRAPP